MRSLLLGLVAAVVFAAVPSVASATPTCRHPGAAPLQIESFVEDNEWYFQPVVGTYVVGCFYVLETSPGGIPEPGHLAPWSYPKSLGFNPDILPGEVVCYRLIQTDAEGGPRFSNWLCIEGFEGEREGGV